MVDVELCTCSEEDHHLLNQSTSNYFALEGGTMNNKTRNDARYSTSRPIPKPCGLRESCHSSPTNQRAGPHAIHEHALPLFESDRSLSFKVKSEPTLSNAKVTEIREDDIVLLSRDECGHAIMASVCGTVIRPYACSNIPVLEYEVCTIDYLSTEYHTRIMRNCFTMPAACRCLRAQDPKRV